MSAAVEREEGLLCWVLGELELEVRAVGVVGVSLVPSR